MTTSPGQRGEPGEPNLALRSVGSVLCVNAGSSSLKCSQYDVGTDGSLRLLVQAMASEIGSNASRLEVLDGSGEVAHHGQACLSDHEAALHLVLDTMASLDVPIPTAVGHRLVHGGPRVTDHVVIQAEVLDRLRAASRFAPLHLPRELMAIDALTRRLPDAVQVACLDTAFHRSIPEISRRLPLPAWVHDEGVRRYGFHGLSCEFVVHNLGADRLGRGIIAHLGSGASVTAVRDGRSVDTTMGLTPTGGVVMGTRSGDLDPGVLVHLLREHELDADALESLVNRQSGLLGLSGRSADLREVLSREQTDPACALAVAEFCASVRKAIGALTTVVDGVDTVVFTGGIGEHAPAIRARVGAGLTHLGVQIDEHRNGSAGLADHGVISTPESPVMVYVVPADENIVIARHTIRLCAP